MEDSFVKAALGWSTFLGVQVARGSAGVEDSHSQLVKVATGVAVVGVEM